MRERTNSAQTVRDAQVASFDRKTDHHPLFQCLGICANNVTDDDGCYHLDMFTDYDALEKEKKIQRAMLEVRSKYVANAVFTGKNILEGATTLERNMQIGGYRA